MIGPPGVGKTFDSKSSSRRSKCRFFIKVHFLLCAIYVGMGAKRVREPFSKAKSYAPSIIFIDEIDAVGKARRLRNDEREATLNPAFNRDGRL